MKLEHKNENIIIDNEVISELVLKRTRTIVFDDMHNGSDIFFAKLNCLIENILRCTQCNLTLILVGRNDYSVLNSEYEKLLCKIANRQEVSHYTIEKWNNQECLWFIEGILKNAPKKIIEKILKTSQNNPFGVIQTIQYLLDKSIAEIYDTNIVGITNIESIGVKDSIPASIKEIIEQRFYCLQEEFQNEELIAALISLCYVQSIFTKEDLNNILEIVFCIDTSKDKVFDEMYIRQFIIELPSLEGRYEFSHENILIYLNSLIENEKYRAIVGKTLLEYFRNEDIEKHQKAYLYFLAKEYESAVDEFGNLLSLISANSANLSSIDIDIKLLKYIRPLYGSLIHTSRHNERDKISSIIQTEAHLSTHLEHLANSLRIIDASLRFIEDNKRHIVDIDKLKLTISGQKAHIILNLGHVAYAKSLLEELVADITLLEYDDEDIKKILFDAHDRLQNIYHQLNSKSMFLYHSKITEKIAESLEDKKLATLAKSSRVKEYYFTDPVEHFKLTKKATRYAIDNASHRHKVHSMLNEKIATLIVESSNTQTIIKIQSELLEIFKEANANKYTFSITRCLLAIATTYALLGLGNNENLKKCEEYADKTIDAIIDYGNGFFKWQVHNLKAIIECNKDMFDKKKADGFFLNAISNLSEQGLLNLGNFDILSVNLSVLSNYFLFLQKTYRSERTMLWLFKKITYNGKCFNSEEKEFESKIIKSLKNSRFIGCKSKIKLILTEPESEFYLALR